VTELAYLDGPATAAVSDQLVAVYRAAMAAPPFFETEVETGWFAAELAGELDEAGYRCWVGRDGDRVVGFAYGFPTPEVPAGGWYGSLREAVGPDAAGHWLEGQFAVVWIAVHPDRRGRGLGRRLLERLLAGAGTERAWLVTHDLDTPAWTPRPALSTAPWGSGSWVMARSAGTTPTGWCWPPNSERTRLNPIRRDGGPNREGSPRGAKVRAAVHRLPKAAGSLRPLAP